MSTSFADLGVPADLIAVLERGGITTPFDVQIASIPDALAGRDVLGRAPTGSGKTLAFGIPLVAHLGKAQPRRPRGLILSPTRELAEQIRRELEPLATARNRTVISVYGGVGFSAQLDGLQAGADLIVACPGRLIDLLEQGELSLGDVDQVVVDEADRMADMGFLPAVRELLDLTSPTRQTVLFSATLDRDVQVLIDNYQNDPVTHEVGVTEPDLSLVKHRFIATKADEKLAIAADLIAEVGPTIVFCRTRHGVDRVARQLKMAGVKAAWIHGARSQSQRDAALHSFTTGMSQAMVATDVAARGIHVDGVACVVHYDPPADAKDYVHRSGRTARAGADGVVVSFVNRDQARAAARMMQDVGLPAMELENAPQLSGRADHVTMDVRSRKTVNGKGPRKPQARAEKPVSREQWEDQAEKVSSNVGRSVSKPPAVSPEAGAPDEREWRVSSSSGPKRRPSRGRSERGVARSTRVEGADQPMDSDSDGSNPSMTPSGQPDTGGASRTAGARRKSMAGGKAKGKSGAGKTKSNSAKKRTADKPKRSGKPRPKNKSAGRK